MSVLLHHLQAWRSHVPRGINTWQGEGQVWLIGGNSVRVLLCRVVLILAAISVLVFRQKCTLVIFILSFSLFFVDGNPEHFSHIL